MKKFRLLVILLILGVGIIFLGKDRRDFRLGVVTDKGVMAVSVSFDRKMVASLEISGEIPLWIPRGLDWYGADKIKKILEQEKKRDLAKEVIYYNLGFWADKVVFLNDFSWKKTALLVKNMGIWSFLEFWYWQDEMLFKQEKIENDLRDESLFLDETMLRDFAEGRLLNEEMRITVYNTTVDAALANFMATLLTRVGFSVMGVGGAEPRGEADCYFIYGEGVKGSYGWQVLNSIYQCEAVKDESLADFEVEIYIGEGYSRMINYSGYVGTF